MSSWPRSQAYDEAKDHPVELSLHDRAATAMKTAIEQLRRDHARRGLPLLRLAGRQSR